MSDKAVVTIERAFRAAKQELYRAFAEYVMFNGYRVSETKVAEVLGVNRGTLRKYAGGVRAKTKRKMEEGSGCFYDLNKILDGLQLELKEEQVCTEEKEGSMS